MDITKMSIHRPVCYDVAWLQNLRPVCYEIAWLQNLRPVYELQLRTGDASLPIVRSIFSLTVLHVFRKITCSCWRSIYARKRSAGIRNTRRVIMQLILWPKKLSRLTIGLITLICLVFLFIIIFSVCRGNVNIQYPPGLIFLLRQIYVISEKE